MPPNGDLLGVERKHVKTGHK